MEQEKNTPKEINGVFWVVEGEIIAIPFTKRMREKYPDAVSESGETFNHEKLWKEIKPEGCDKPYNYYPRGIVVNFKRAGASNRTPQVYASQHINLLTVHEVVRAFGQGKYFHLRYDYSEHYKCYLDRIGENKDE